MVAWDDLHCRERSKLGAKGYRIAAVRGGYGDYQAIRIDTEHGILVGGSAPRKDGGAMGY